MQSRRETDQTNWRNKWTHWDFNRDNGSHYKDPSLFWQISVYFLIRSERACWGRGWELPYQQHRPSQNVVANTLRHELCICPIGGPTTIDYSTNIINYLENVSMLELLGNLYHVAIDNSISDNNYYKSIDTAIV